MRTSVRVSGDPYHRLGLQLRERFRRVLTIGVTGTKGKTSTAEILYQMLESAQVKAALMTGVSSRVAGRLFVPCANLADIANFMTLAEHFQVECVVVELTSHALRAGVHRYLDVNCGILTNIGTDHVRQHGNRRNYLHTKLLLFQDLHGFRDRAPLAVLNADDADFEFFRRRIDVPLVTYGSRRRAHLRVRDLVQGASGMRFVVEGLASRRFKTRLVGGFNALNMLAAVACAKWMGVSPGAMVRSIGRMSLPPGRMHVISAPSPRRPAVVIDYAHTPESLRAALEAGRYLAPGGRCWAVFGCSGDPYKRKRRLMGAVAAQLADRIVLTTENPWFEDPMAIAREILRGIPRSAREKTTLVIDRATAIRQTLGEARPGDVVMILGRGCDNHQVVRGKLVPLSDIQVACTAIGIQPVSGAW